MTGAHHGRMAANGLPALLAALTMTFPLLAGAADPQLPSAVPGGGKGKPPGAQIYLEGRLPSGRPVQAWVRGDLSLTGKQAACVSCHRRSGMGSVEGRTVARPVTGPALYSPWELYAGGPFLSLREGPHKWPAYTDETLARAIREGIDPSGRILDPVMPRYRFGDEDMRFIISYLKALSSSEPPGVTETVIRFGTVVDGRVDPAKRNAMLDVLRAFFTDISVDPRNQMRRAKIPRQSLARQSRAYRKWELDVWELSGPETTWEAQLEDRYRARPVFALISGIASGGWGPIHRFCEKFEVPSLFPNVILPVVSETDYHSFYFSRGMTLEAEALARHMEGERAFRDKGTIVQVYRDDEAGTVSAEAFRNALRKHGMTGLRDRRIGKGESLTPGFWAGLAASERPIAVVLWLRADAPGALGLPEDTAAIPRRIYLSSGLADVRRIAIPESVRDKVFLLNSFAHPLEEQRLIARSSAWIRNRGINNDPEERLQANTLFGVALAMEALDHMLGNFSRDYFIEWIEHQAENALTPSAYPRMALGPGQRYASKGCYILGYSRDAQDWALPIDGWIVP